MSTDAVAATAAAIQHVRLIDHHVHGASRGPIDRPGLEMLLTESDRPIPPWMSQFDSQIGFAIRRWCAPVLGLEPHTSAEEYVNHRAQLGPAEVTRRLLSASGVDRYLLETGYRGGDILGLDEMAATSSSRVHEVVRLEAVAEELATTGISARDFHLRYPEVLAERALHAVGLKSIIAYRHGFDFDPARPTAAEVTTAAAGWLRGWQSDGVRIDDPVLLRFVLWSAIDLGLPLQLHTGYGDPDLRLDRCDPLLLTPWIKLVEPSGVDLMLLHCYPYQRHAGYLAQVFPHVYFDVGLGTNYTGARSDALIAESLELAPFSKILFSSDAWGPPELHYLGALLWRRGMQRTVARWVADDDWSADDATRVVNMVGADNARRVYQLDEASAQDSVGQDILS